MNNLQSQSGSTLVVALLFLVIITLLGVTSMRASSMELIMAGNTQIQMEAVDRAQSIIDGVIANVGTNIFTSLSPGTAHCTANYPIPSECAAMTVTLPAETIFTNNTATPNGISAQIIQLSDVQQSTLAPPRGLGSSITEFEAVAYAIIGRYDESEIGNGSRQVIQGYLSLIPKGQ